MVDVPASHVSFRGSLTLSEVPLHFPLEHHHQSHKPIAKKAYSEPTKRQVNELNFQLHNLKIYGWTLNKLSIITLPKIDTNTKNDGFWNVSPFKHGYFWGIHVKFI